MSSRWVSTYPPFGNPPPQVVFPASQPPHHNRDGQPLWRRLDDVAAQQAPALAFVADDGAAAAAGALHAIMVPLQPVRDVGKHW